MTILPYHVSIIFYYIVKIILRSLERLKIKNLKNEISFFLQYHTITKLYNFQKKKYDLTEIS